MKSRLHRNSPVPLALSVCWYQGSRKGIDERENGVKRKAQKSQCLRLEGWVITRAQENPSFKMIHVLECEAGSAWVGGEGAPAEQRMRVERLRGPAHGT